MVLNNEDDVYEEIELTDTIYHDWMVPDHFCLVAPFDPDRAWARVWAAAGVVK